MGSIGGSICKTTSIKCAMEQIPVEAVFLLLKTELGHPLIYLPHTLMWWRITGHRNTSKLFYCCGHIQWLLESSGRRGCAQKTGIIHPGRKSAVESDSYGGPKFSFNICINDDEATNGMGHTSQIMWFEKCFINNYFWLCVTVWSHIRTASSLLNNSPVLP